MLEHSSRKPLLEDSSRKSVKKSRRKPWQDSSRSRRPFQDSRRLRRRQSTEDSSRSRKHMQDRNCNSTEDRRRKLIEDRRRLVMHLRITLRWERLSLLVLNRFSLGWHRSRLLLLLLYHIRLPMERRRNMPPNSSRLLPWLLQAPTMNAANRVATRKPTRAAGICANATGTNFLRAREFPDLKGHLQSCT